MKSWMHEFSIKDFSLELSLKNKDAIEDAAEYLNNIIGYCRDNGASPVIVIPPVYHTLNEKFSPKLKLFCLINCLVRLMISLFLF